MKSLLIVVMLTFFSVSAVAAECDPVTALNTKIQVVKDNDEVESLEVQIGDKATVLPWSGPGNKCLGLSFFERSRIVVVHYETGALGTQVLHQREIAVAYQLTKMGLKQLREFEIRHVEQDVAGARTLVDGSLLVQDTAEGLRVEVRSKSGEVRESAVLP